MATDPLLLDRIRNSLMSKHAEWEEKKMFGGHCFMIDDKMCFGTYKEGIMARVHPEEIEELIQMSGTSQMIHRGKPMTGYIFIEEEGFAEDEQLDFVIQKCLDFNPLAKASKKRSKERKSNGA